MSRFRSAIPKKSFFGRYGLFLFVGLAQGLIVSLGDLIYVGIQCLHPVRFVLAACLNGICFTMINYALVFSLESIGQALGVIVLCLPVFPVPAILNETAFLLSRWETIAGAVLVFLISVHLVACSLTCSSRSGAQKEKKEPEAAPKAEEPADKPAQTSEEDPFDTIFKIFNSK